MPKIDFNFQGYIRGADVEAVYEIISGREVDVRNKSAKDVVAKLNDGTWSLALVDFLPGNFESQHVDIADSEIELHDYEAHRP